MRQADLGVPADSFLDLAISMAGPGQNEAALRLVLIVNTRAQCTLRQPLHLQNNVVLTCFLVLQGRWLFTSHLDTLHSLRIH